MCIAENMSCVKESFRSEWILDHNRIQSNLHVRPPLITHYHSVLHFEWSLTGGSTVKYLEALCTVDFAVFLLPFSNIVLYSGYHGL